jgi:drug/metabolite transporter (DMT)-like permease
MPSRSAGWILIAVSAVSFGLLGVLVKIGYSKGVDPFSTLAFRFAVGAALLVPVALIRRRPFPRGRTLVLILLFGACGYVAHSLCFFYSLKYASAGLTSLLLYLYPALVALGGAAFFGERLGRGRLAALAVALIGTALAVAPGPGNRPLGIGLALACAFIYSSYILACSRVGRGEDPLNVATLVVSGAAVIYGAIALAIEAPLPPSPAAWAAVAGIGIFSTAVAIGAFFAAMERIGPTSASIGSTLEPVVTVVLSAIVLHEGLSGLQLAGGTLILVAVVWLATRPRAASA